GRRRPVAAAGEQRDEQEDRGRRDRGSNHDGTEGSWPSGQSGYRGKASNGARGPDRARATFRRRAPERRFLPTRGAAVRPLAQGGARRRPYAGPPSATMTGTAERPSSHFGFGAPVLEEALLVEHRADSGWGAPEFLPRRAGDVPMASAAVQYGLSCFEGLKAFRGPDGSVHLFRADRHGERLAQSCARLCLPVLPPAEFVAHASAFVRRNAHHVPPHGQGALYVRPTLAAVEAYPGVRPARRHVFALLATPVPRPASRPMALWIEREYVRAAPGGIGAAKTGGNYAAGLLGAERARQRGFDQVVWLDAVQRRFVAEAGVMN